MQNVKREKQISGECRGEGQAARPPYAMRGCAPGTRRVGDRRSNRQNFPGLRTGNAVHGNRRNSQGAYAEIRGTKVISVPRISRYFHLFPDISAYFRVFPHNGFLKKCGRFYSLTFDAATPP
jgi:hypothetical protein